VGLIIDEPEELNTGTKLYPKDIINHTILVWATDYIPHSPTQFNDGSDPKKPCDVVVVDVIDLDQLDEEQQQLGLISRGSWWRQGRLIQRFKVRVGKPNPLVGRIAKGLGPNGAFEFVDLSSDEKTVARANAWWAANPGFVPSGPVGQATQAHQPELTIPQQQVPVPPPSPLEQQANASLGVPAGETPAQRLKRLSAELHAGLGQVRNAQSDTPPF
jgi:hypothetical protein